MFKVNFQKAFDSVRWDHLDDILGKFSFGNKWRGWIRGFLISFKASVLVNGSPTDVFSFHRGLNQVDPLSNFLFILVMESLHVSFQRLIDRGMFVPVTVRKDNLVPISHLFCADDAMFIGKWSSSNVSVLMLGISSLLALNLALLFKWIWRFLTSQSGLYKNVIKAIRGNNGSIDMPFKSRVRGSV
nr:cysteine-rich receptor-like protein kinase [Tanacetum cinerariifolium]